MSDEVIDMKKWIILLTMAMVFLGACSEEEAYPTIEISEIESYQTDGYLVVDVREKSEYDAGHIPGAMNKPLSEISSGNFDNLDPSQPYVIVCQSGNRSKQASDSLADADYEIVNVKQGMSSWTGPIE